MTTITTPGRYSGIPADDYHGQLTPAPSLSSSMARTLTKSCPAKMWHGSYLNPERETEHKRTFEIGQAAHLMFLEPDDFVKRTEIVEADDYRTKAAQQARDAARAAGLIPLLPQERDMLLSMRVALMANPMARKAFEAGEAEATFVAREPETGVWLKARPDWIPHHGRWIVDYKTCTSAHPDDVAKAMWEHRYFQQDPFYRDVIAMSGAPRPEKTWFVFQEKEPPYLVTVHVLDASDVTAGENLNAEAIRTFAECLLTGRWPGYSDTAIVSSLPHFARLKLGERFDAAAAADQHQRALRQSINPKTVQHFGA